MSYNPINFQGKIAGPGDTPEGVDVDATDWNSTTVTIDIDGTTIKPEYVEESEASLIANTEEHTDNCGNTEVRRNGDKNWQLTLTGAVVEETKNELVIASEKDAAALITTDTLGQREFIIDDVTLTQADGEVTARFDVDGETREGLVFNFMIKTKNPQQGA